MYVELLFLTLKNVVPGLFSMLFRIFGLGARSKKAAWTGISVYLLVSLLVPLILIPIFGYDIYKQFNFFVLLLANASVFIISSDGFLKTCFLHFSQANIIFWISTVLSAVRRLTDTSHTILTIMLAIVCAGAFFLAIRFFAKPMRFMADTIRSGWLGLIAVPGLTVLAGTMVAVWFGMQDNYNSVMMIAVTTLLELSFVMYMRGLYHSLNENTRLSREKTRQKLLESELRAYDDYLSSAKQTRHDIRHHNSVLAEYLSAGDINGAKDYLNAYNISLDKSALTEYCENKTANAVLRLFARNASDTGISFEVRADIPADMRISDSDFGVLLSNILENAIRSCKSIAEGSILFIAQKQDGALHIEVTNSVSGQITFSDGIPQSSRPDGGIGTQSMIRTVRASGGMIRFRQEGTTFVTQVIIPI